MSTHWTRREFLQTTATSAAAVSLSAGLLAGPANDRGTRGPSSLTAPTARTRIALSDGWRVKQLEPDKADAAALTREAAAPDETWLSARMPAQVHDVLLAHGLISDPRIGKNAAASAWVGEKDWAYACKFSSPQRVSKTAFLRFHGLDTLAAAWLNGRSLGRFDNMYREYAVNVSEVLSPPGQPNVLLIVFSSPLRFMERLKPPAPAKSIARHKYLRKCHSDFGSYLGARPHSVKVGIYREVVLDLPGTAWLDDVWVRTELSPDFKQARLVARVVTAGVGSAVKWRVKSPSGELVADGRTEPFTGQTDLRVVLSEVQLWWPHTHGTPHLYQLEIALVDEEKLLDQRTVHFGVRDIQPVRREPGTGEKRFRFNVNGRPIFLRGACWAPAEGRTHCWPRERARRLLDLAGQGRMNVLRVWGEGHVPPDEFYEECDRRGLLVWQDFMFGYGTHPTDDPGFAANCRAEVQDIVRRLRNHPCILLWVGGNENHMGWDFAHGKAEMPGDELFARAIPEICAEMDPTRIFHPSSPYGGPVPNWPLEGDWHDYTTLTFSPEASVPTFASEVGRVSAYSLTSMRRFLSEEELWPPGHLAAIRKPGEAAWPPMWQYRSVDGSWDKVGALEQYCDPVSAADLIRVLGTAHGEYLQQRVERERRGVPDDAPAGSRRCWGNMVWRLNDAWPIIYWSVIDYYLEPKIAFYFLRRAYDPILVCFERTPDRIHVWIVNDSPDAVEGLLKVERKRFNGNALGELHAAVAVKPGEARRCLDCTPFGPISLREEFLEATFSERSATMLLTSERHLHLPRAHLEARRTAGGIEMVTDAFARQVSLEVESVTGAVFEDNFFDLGPRRKREVKLIDAAGGTKIRVQALNAEVSIYDL